MTFENKLYENPVCLTDLKLPYGSTIYWAPFTSFICQWRTKTS